MNSFKGTRCEAQEMNRHAAVASLVERHSRAFNLGIRLLLANGSGLRCRVILS